VSCPNVKGMKILYDEKRTHLAQKRQCRCEKIYLCLHNFICSYAHSVCGKILFNVNVHSVQHKIGFGVPFSQKILTQFSFALAFAHLSIFEKFAKAIAFSLMNS
jgi:hypothetical protein